MTKNNTKLNVTAVRMPHRISHANYSKDRQPTRNPGRPAGSRNRITREMRDAVIAAAEELGGIDCDKWNDELKGDPENGLKQYCKALAVKEMRTFGIILARMMPKFVHRSTVKKDVPVVLTEEQMLAELKASGLPLEIIKHMRKVDIRTIETSSLDYDPYDFPADDDELVDVTPKEPGAGS
jgi:hypothetical protein